MQPLTKRVDDDEAETVVFDILSSPRRRYALRLLYEEPDRIRTLAQLSTHVAGRENRIPVDEVTLTERKRVYVSLYQTHIPLLEEAGIVRYDRNTGRIRLTNRVARIGPYLDLPMQTDDVTRVYLLLASVSAIFLLAVLVEAPFVSGISDATAALIVLIVSLGVGLSLGLWRNQPPGLRSTAWLRFPRSNRYPRH